MSDFDFDNFGDGEESYSESFTEWDNARKMGIPPGYFDADELCDIIDTYLSLDQVAESKEVVEHAVRIHPDNEDMVYDIMQMLNDYELWDDLLELTNRYKDLRKVWIDAHKVTALLHLGMEENAFSHFRKAKARYAGDKKDLTIIYLAMAESLHDIDLYEATIDVIDEILPQIKAESNEDLLWIQLQCYQAINDKNSVISLCEQLIELRPMDADTWSRLGLVYKEIGEKEKSIDAFEFAASLGKKEPIDMLNLIYSYKENGNLLKALEKADEYLETSPNDYIINLLAANICIEIEDWQKALQYTEKALSVDASADFLYLYKSKCLLNLGEIKKAILSLEEGLKKTKDTSGELEKTLLQLKEQYPDY